MKLVVVVWILFSVAACMPHRRAAPAQQPAETRPFATLPVAAPQRVAWSQVAPQFLVERGALIEILGLRHWTPAMLRDSLAVHAPGAALASTTLAATLRDKLGFPEAAAWRQSGDSAVNVLVAVIEPRDSSRIRRRTFAGDTAQSRARWAPLVEFARTRLDLLEDVLEPPVYARAVGLPPAMPLEVRPDSAEVRQVWALLEAHRSAEDMATAGRLLTSSPNVYDRLTGVAILSNFEREDAAWHALVGAILDPDPRARGLAARVLRAFTSQAARRVDWRPAAQELHAILDGSELSSLGQVLDLLVATGVEPELAGPLLRNGGHAVLMFAGATRPEARLPSYRFLRAVSGGQHRASPDEWHAWIAALRP